MTCQRTYVQKMGDSEDITSNISKYNPSWEIKKSSLSSKRIPRMLWNQKLHFRAHNSPPPFPILSQFNPSTPSPFPTASLRSSFISSRLRLGVGYVFSSGFPTKTLYAILFCPICATWPAHLTILDLYNLIFGFRIKVMNFLITTINYAYS